jgi:hypothetical protein
LTDDFCATGAHHKQDIRCAFQGAAENDHAFRREPIHEIGMLSPLWLALQTPIGQPSGALPSDDSK